MRRKASGSPNFDPARVRRGQRDPVDVFRAGERLREAVALRKQYHFHPSKKGSREGVRIWDVDRLIELSRDLPRKRVPLASIREVDEVYWFDGDENLPTCRQVLLHMRLVEETDLAHPIILGADGRVMDGMHRVLKALSQDHVDIEAVQFEQDPEPNHIDRKASELSYERTVPE